MTYMGPPDIQVFIDGENMTKYIVGINHSVDRDVYFGGQTGGAIHTGSATHRMAIEVLFSEEHLGRPWAFEE